MAELAVVQYMAGNGHSFSLPPPPLQPPLDEPFCSWLNIFTLPTWIAEGFQETHLLSGRYMYILEYIYNYCMSNLFKATFKIDQLSH